MEVSSELNRLAELAQLGKLRPDDISGGTFTLSNVGAVSQLCVKVHALYLLNIMLIFHCDCNRNHIT